MVYKPKEIEKMSVIFDPNEILEQIGGEKELLREIIKIFIDTYPEDLKTLQNSILEKEPESIRKAAHRIKGSVSNFGQYEAFKSAKEIECKAREGELSDMANMYDELVGNLLSLENEVKRYLDESA
jgi:HPt (histidine-containing phosphotransfer) domain-containing protein